METSGSTTEHDVGTNVASLRSLRQQRHAQLPESIDRARVLEIALGAMSDVVRNDNITLAYHVLSRQMAAFLADDVNGNWCTFGVWGSSSAGTGIRTTSLPARMATSIRDLPTTAAVRRRLTQRVIKLRSSGPRHPARALAAGNRGVFYEMGLAYVSFFELFASEPSPSDEDRLLDELVRRVGQLPPTLGSAWPDVDQSLLRNGFAAYLDARRAPTPGDRAQAMLLGNLYLAEYEQRRLQTWLVIAVNEPLQRMQDARDDGKRVRERALRGWFQLVTRHLLAVDLGGETLPVDVDLTAPKGEAFIPPDLRVITNPLLIDMLQSLDPIHLDAPVDWAGEDTAVTSWIDIDQRMRFIATLFRSRQQNRQLWNAPFPDSDVAAIASGREPARISSARVDRRAIDSALHEPWSPTNLDALRQRGDAPVDELVSRYWDERGTPANDRRFVELMLELRAGEEMHNAIADYLDRPVALPRWAEPERIRNGQAFYRTLRLPINLALLVSSLPEAYGAEDGVTVLELASALVTDAKRRIGQTAQFVLDISLTDPLDPGSVASQSIRGVRLMHAAVRHMIVHSGYGAERTPPPPWNNERGIPINQEDLLGTMLSFAIPPIDFVDRIGMLLDQRRAEDYLHLWCVVGSMLGIDDDLLVNPTDPSRTMSVAQARDLAAVIRSRHHRPSSAGQHLTEALQNTLLAHTPRGLRGFPSALIRFSIGDDLADALRVGPRGLSDFAVDRAARLGSSLQSDRWYRWAMPAVIERLGDEWYRIFAEGGYAADPGFRLTPDGQAQRRTMIRTERPIDAKAESSGLRGHDGH